MSRIARAGTVISGTLNSRDLIPAFMEELDDLKEEMGMTRDPSEFGFETQLQVQHSIGNIDHHLGQIEERIQTPDYFASEEADWDLEWLFDAIDSLAPDGFHFSAHEGDGSDFGYWENDPDENLVMDDEEEGGDE